MPIVFSDRELDLMTILWRHGPSTAAEVRERLEDDLAYNTVLTVLRILEEKGYVGHTAEGRAHRYRPLVGREAATTSALTRFVDRVFEGSAELMMAHLVHDRRLGAAEIHRLRRMLDEQLDDRGRRRTK